MKLDRRTVLKGAVLGAATTALPTCEPAPPPIQNPQVLIIGDFMVTSWGVTTVWYTRGADTET